MSKDKLKKPRVRKRRRPPMQPAEGVSLADDASAKADTETKVDAAQQREETDAYRVGYCRPPLQNRFKKGKSGNPKGRPKGRKNTRTLVRETLYTPITVRENGREKRIPALHAMLVQLRNKAVAGDPRAIDKVLKLLPYLDESEKTAGEADAAAPSFDPEQDRALLDEFAQMIRDSGSPASKEGEGDEQ